MSYWNYRIVRYKDGSGYGLHEVYYDDADLPWAMTEEHASFCCDVDERPTDIVSSLQKAIKDAKNRPVLDEPLKWPGKAPKTR